MSCLVYKMCNILHVPASRIVPLFSSVQMNPGDVSGLPHKDVKNMLCLIRKHRINDEITGDDP
jgi:hypothetical protein